MRAGALTFALASPAPAGGVSRAQPTRVADRSHAPLTRGRATLLDVLGGLRSTAVTESGIRRSHPHGSVLVRQSETPSNVVLVLGGHVKLVATAAGRELMLAIREPGEPACGLAALQGGECTATAVAIGAVETVSVPYREIAALCERDPAAGLAIAGYLRARLSEEERRRLWTATSDTTARVARGLVELAERFGSSGEAGIRIDIALSQEELAGWTSSSHKALTTALARLRRLGLVQTGRRAVAVCDLGALRDLAVMDRSAPFGVDSGWEA